MDCKGHTYLQWAVALLANTVLLSYGLEAGWMSPMTSILQSKDSPTGEPLSDYTISYLASIMCMTAVFGVPLFAFITERYGRKVGVIAIALPQAVSWIIRIFFGSTTALVVARILGGFSAGGCFNVIPMYVKEISQDSIRGTLGSLLVLFQNFGILIMYIMGATMNYYTILWTVSGLPIVTAVLMMKAPESPAYLVKKGNLQEATRVVALLRGLEQNDKIVQNEVDGMVSEEEHFKSLPEISILSILKNKAWRRGLFLITTVFTAHATNGAFSIVSYASTILSSTGGNFNISPDIQTLSFPIAMIIGSLSLTACVEKVGRKPLLMSAFLVTACSMCCLGALMLLKSRGYSTPGWLPAVAMMLVVMCYAGGISPVPYVIVTELFNFQIRGKLIGLVVTYTWFMTFVQVLVYAPISSSLGMHTMFLCYAAINLFGAVFVLVFLPETKSKSIEEIEFILSGNVQQHKTACGS